MCRFADSFPVVDKRHNDLPPCRKGNTPIVVDELLPGPPQIETASLAENAPEASVADPPRTQDHKQEM